MTDVKVFYSSVEVLYVFCFVLFFNLLVVLFLVNFASIIKNMSRFTLSLLKMNTVHWSELAQVIFIYALSDLYFRLFYIYSILSFSTVAFLDNVGVAH